MTQLMDPPEHVPEAADPRAAPASGRLRAQTAAMRISFTWFGTRKTLSVEQKARAAESFGAAGEYISAGKKLLDTKHASVKTVTAVKGRIVAYWKGISLPFPEQGIRLIRQDAVDAVNAHMEQFRADLSDAVEKLDKQFGELKAAARSRLGSLFCDADYPESLQGLFEVSWDFPSVEPPPYLRQLSPDLYQRECRRMAARFDEAVTMAEQAFTEELSKLVSHLCGRLAGADDGKPKVFRDSAVTNILCFFERFSKLNVTSNAQLDELVEQARQVVQGIQPQQLRDSDGLRQKVASQLGQVQTVLDGLLVDRPRRNILRRPR